MCGNKIRMLEYFIDKVVFTDFILNKIGLEQMLCVSVSRKERKGFHICFYCKELESFLRKCKCVIKDLTVEWDENGMEWNRVVMFGGKRNAETKSS